MRVDELCCSTQILFKASRIISSMDSTDGYKLADMQRSIYTVHHERTYIS